MTSFVKTRVQTRTVSWGYRRAPCDRGSVVCTLGTCCAAPSYVRTTWDIKSVGRHCSIRDTVDVSWASVPGALADSSCGDRRCDHTPCAGYRAPTLVWHRGLPCPRPAESPLGPCGGQVPASSPLRPCPRVPCSRVVQGTLCRASVTPVGPPPGHPQHSPGKPEDGPGPPPGWAGWVGGGGVRGSWGPAAGLLPGSDGARVPAPACGGRWRQCQLGAVSPQRQRQTPRVWLCLCAHLHRGVCRAAG